MSSTPRTRTIYVVDDDEEVRHSICFMLSADGVKCSPFSDGNKFLAAAAELPAGCVLLDYKMNGPSYPEFGNQLKKLDPRWQVILMSGATEEELSRAVMADGAITYVAKPFTEEDLLTVLETYCF